MWQIFSDCGKIWVICHLQRFHPMMTQKNAVTFYWARMFPANVAPTFLETAVIPIEERCASRQPFWLALYPPFL